MHVLRLEIGDAAFFRLLRGWVRQNTGGNVTTAQFIELAERISVQGPRAFFTEVAVDAGRPASLDAATAAARSAPLSAAPARSRKAVRR